jgi:hypothetical protein
MRGIKPPRYRQAAFHFNSYGMPELHPALHQMRPDQDVPARQVVDEQRTARFQDADALAQPEFAPIDIFGVAARIVRPAPINLPKIERRIGKNRIGDPGRKTRQDIETVALEQHASRGCVIWSRQVRRGDDRAERAVCHRQPPVSRDHSWTSMEHVPRGRIVLRLAASLGVRRHSFSMFLFRFLIQSRDIHGQAIEMRVSRSARIFLWLVTTLSGSSQYVEVGTASARYRWEWPASSPSSASSGTHSAG